MNKEEARQYIRDRATDYLKPDRSKKGYICPICGSGGGMTRTKTAYSKGVLTPTEIKAREELLEDG